MFCNQCGETAGDDAIICAKCGAALTAAVTIPSEKPVTRRWVRFWARTFDMDLFFFTIGIVSAFINPHFFSRFNQMAVGLVLIFSWVFVEAWLLSTFQTTPGKWLFKTKIALASGEPITYSKALARSFMVWWRGMGFGFPIVTTITLIISSIVITRNGITPWDEQEGFVITHEKIGVPRVLAAMAFFGIVFMIMIVGESAKH
jgi:uncharacterized RDD family membrane protein YckC